MQLVMLGLWALLKEHNGLTDADLKRFMQGAAVSHSDAAGNPAIMKCENCHHIIRKSAT